MVHLNLLFMGGDYCDLFQVYRTFEATRRWHVFSLLAEVIPVFGIDVRLIQDAAERPDGNFRLFRHNCCVNDLGKSADKFDVTTALANFDKAHGFKATLDLAEGLRLKPPQPQPRP